MSTSVLPQLLEVDSELLAQMSALEAQLNELQEKRKGIQSVIGMFASGEAPQLEDIAVFEETPVVAKASAKAVPENAPEKSAKPKTAKVATAKVATAKVVTPKTSVPKAVSAKTTAAKTTAAKTTAAKTTAAKTSPAKAVAVKAVPAKEAAPKVAAKLKAAASKAVKSKTAKAPEEKAAIAKVKVAHSRPAKAKTKAVKAVSDLKASVVNSKRSGRTANWQRYVQENYSKAPLPDVVVGVLQAQPNSIFKIADVMNVVFKEDMPKSHFLKARNRVSNILSAGAREGDWYRGRGGTYSVSEKAIKAVG